MESHLYTQRQGAFLKKCFVKKSALWEASTKGQSLPVCQTKQKEVICLLIEDRSANFPRRKCILITFNHVSHFYTKKTTLYNHFY